MKGSRRRHRASERRARAGLPRRGARASSTPCAPALLSRVVSAGDAPSGAARLLRVSTARAQSRPELEIAVDKMREGARLTERERAAVSARGLELAVLVDERPGPGGEGGELGPEVEEELLGALVEAEADERDGQRLVPWRELFPPRAAG